MQRETRRRIEYYQDTLPHMKEKVAVAAMMLFIALIVVVTATYAWVTLSVAPVVSSVNTTVASNGNLEIALAPADGSLPAEFDVDESVTASTNVTVSNLQWGNLINLSDPAYGIDNLVLRPAQLNTASLKYSPLWGAVYGADGRISTLNSNYTYTAWDGNEFVASRDYGVRAIASYILTTSESTSAAYKTMAEAVNAAHNKVNTAYSLVPGKMGALSSMLSSFVQSKVPEDYGGGDETPFTPAQIGSAYELYTALLDAMELQKDALVALANFQSYVDAQNNVDASYVELTWDDLVAKKTEYNAKDTSTKSSNGVISLVGLTQFITDVNQAESDVAYLKMYQEGAADGSLTVYWDRFETTDTTFSGPTLEDIVSKLLDYTKLTVMIDGEEVTFSALAGSPMTYAPTLLGMDKEHTKVTIYSGILKRFEQMAIDENYRLKGQENNAVMTVKVKAKVVVTVTITVYGDCYTTASGTSYFMSDYVSAMGQEMVGSDAVAEDTYGMAVDFWVRTNSENTYLTLEGALVSDTDGTIYGYDGVNRVWGSTNTANLTTNSTTQGSGSCYIYYADTPEDMARSLDLLQSMKVAFVDADGNLMASASMDTQNYYAINGRITVPLVVEENSGVAYTYVDDTNTEQTARALVQMTNDEPKWVTAIVYLDGARLSNDNVLAAADIDGQLNIQFGSSANLNTRGDNKLLVEERTVVAEAAPTSLDFVNATLESDLTTNVTVRVDGADPDTITGFFVRAVNSTQGERQSTMTFTKQTDGTWKTSYVFDAPGTYYLRYVRLDGVDYALEDPPKVEVSGFSVQSIAWGESSKEATVYSADSSYAEPVTVRFASTSASQMPSAVQARFIREDGNTVNVELIYNSSTGSWSGTGTFYTSGTYSLQYLLLDGEYYDVSTEGYVLNLSLGLNVAVYNNGSSTNDMYDADADKNAYSKNVGVKIFDNAGNELKAMEGAKLRYSLGGSATNTVDTDLKWDDANEWYTGTLPIVKPGRYTFSEVNIAGSRLTKATESPTYIIVSPDPPVYQTSVSYYYDEVQFAPLTNDAFIGPITIDNTAAAVVSAIVHNDITDKDYTITMSDVQTVNGTMYYENNKWYINLPVYTNNVDSDGNPLENAVYTQEGTWSVKQISVWDCYDEDSNFRDETDPIIWTDTDVDFSKLTTEVSCSVNVNMVSGTTALGSADSLFMANNYVKDIGMYVTLQDNSGRTIPAATGRAISLTVDYASNTGDNYNADYGYEVVGLNTTYTIEMVQDESTGNWVVDTSKSNHNWQYVGEYKVSKLTVQMSGNTDPITILPGENGVPQMYTVTSQGPDADNLSIKRIVQNQYVFGKDTTTGEITGKFLDSYNPKIVAELKLTYEDENNETQEATYARVDGTSVSLTLTYKDGNSAPNGGYTWSGTSPYSVINMAMTNNNTGIMQYESGTSPMLAGTYSVSGTLTVGSSSKTFSGMDDISVYSMAPTLTVNSYSYDDGTTFTCKDQITTDESNMENNSSSLASRLVSCTNSYDDTGDAESILTLHFPAIELTGTSSGRTRYGLFYNNSTDEDTCKDNTRADEVRPKISFKLLYGGNYDTNASIIFVGDNSDQSVTWTLDYTTSISDVQNIGILDNDNNFSSDYCEGRVYWTDRTKFGSASVDKINLINNSVTYTVDLAKKFTINNPN